MPNYPAPITGPMGPIWTPILQNAQAQKQKAANLAGAMQQGNTYDKWQNVVEVSGSNLNQVVTIGAGWKVGGVEVATGIANGTAGRAKQENLLTGTISYVGASQTPTVTAGITLTAGSTAATLDSSLATAWAGSTNYMIGAVVDLTTYVEAIAPGTFVYAISGTSVTLSAKALEGGSGLYVAACQFTQV